MVLVFSSVSNTGNARMRGMENRMKRFPLLFCVAAALPHGRITEATSLTRYSKEEARYALAPPKA